MTARIQTAALRTLSLTFEHSIYARQLPQWRGAFIEWAGIDNDLFHNHDNQPTTDHQYIHRYPLIQYRIHKGKAGIFAINEGIEAVQQVLSSSEWKIRWEDRDVPLLIENMHMNEHYLRMSDRPRTYKLFKWLALNDENYERWNTCTGLTERITLLENILTGHILGFATNMNWQLPDRLEVSLQHLQQVQQVRCHGRPMLAFNVAYSANVLLPYGIGLGKAVSHGFGWQQPVKIRRPRHTKTQANQQAQVLI